MPYVLMKIFEEAPRKFDRWMQLLTLGRLHEIREEIACGAVAPEAKVLEIGCGPGTLAVRLAERGARVVGIDTSDEMLAVARKKLDSNGRASRLEFRKLSALEIEDSFAAGSFDHVIGILVLSELTSEDEIDCVLLQSGRLLGPSGQLILADEVEPKGTLLSWLFRALRYLMRLFTFLVLQAKDLQSSNIFKKILYYLIEFPLMLLTFFVVPPATRPIPDLAERVERAGFRVVNSKTYLAGTLQLLQAEKAS